MFGLTPYNRGLQRRGYNNDFNSLFDDFFTDSFFTEKRNIASFKLDIQEKEDAYVVEAEIPGVTKEELSIDYFEEKLHIKVTKEEKEETEKKDYVHKERRVSNMERIIMMKNIDDEKIEAKLENGILEIKVPKLDKEKDRKKIEIQ